MNVAPFATEIVRRRSQDSGESDDERAGGISINYSGPQGSLIPTGFVSSANGRFTSNIRFYNTPNVVQPNLYANNLRLKDTVPHLVLRNTSPDFLTARPRFLTAAGTPSGMVKLPTLRLRPSEIVEVDLRPLMLAARNRSDLDSVSVQVLNSGAPGSLIGALYSQDRTTGVTYDVPLRDSGSPRASTGAYPVRLDGDYTTVLSITNVTDKQGEFTLQVNYDGGTYELGLVTAIPGETKTFDIRKLRDEQTPDRNGHPFPRDLSTGQIRWSMRGNGSVPLFGRAEVVSQRDSVSSSYSCVTCCPHSFNDGWLDPGYSQIFSGDSQQILGKERQRDCYGNIYGPYDMSWGNWYAANPDIATMDGSGQATGVSPGTAGFSFTWTTYYWMQDFDEQCIPYESSESGSSTVDVVPAPDHVRVISDNQGVLCEGGLQVRQITVQIVDINNQDVTRIVFVRENFQNVSTNTCGNPVPSPWPCQLADWGGRFTDSMAVSDHIHCDSQIDRNSGCGYTLKSTWSVCLSPRGIWQYNGETRSNIVRVDGGIQFAPGTYLYAPIIP